MGAARNLLNDWQNGSDLDDLESFTPISSSPKYQDMPDTVMRRSNHKKIDRAIAVRRQSKENLLETDVPAGTSA